MPMGRNFGGDPPSEQTENRFGGRSTGCWADEDRPTRRRPAFSSLLPGARRKRQYSRRARSRACPSDSRASLHLKLWLPTVGSTSEKASRRALRPRVCRRNNLCQATVNVKLYVGNLSFSIGDQQLREAFAPHGNLLSASVVTDRESGQSRGFGFVEFGSSSEAEGAIAAMNGATLDGRTLNVNVAKPREGGGPGGGRGGGGGRSDSRGGGGRSDSRGGGSKRW
jgi:hypothetical protein